MVPDVLADHFRDELGERVLDASVAYGQVTVTVPPEDFPTVARFCKQTLGMTFFDFLSGVDAREDGFTVVARVYNHISRSSVILKTAVPGGRDEPHLPTLTDVYRGANWHERETYDMFGIVFDGHPGLLPRILTVENFEGWPLRKEFLLTSREVKPWPGAKEPADDAGDSGDAGSAKPAAAASPTPGADPSDRAAAAKAKAERAKAKAAAARKRKAEEKAALQAAEDTTGPQAAPQVVGSASDQEDKAALQAAEDTTGQPDDSAAPQEGPTDE